MNEHFFLEWALVALSLFNAIVLLWLGLTVLLNADRRHWGVWLMSGGLFAGALFFVSHTAILSQGVLVDMSGLNAWWRIGWLPVIIIPYVWYVVVLWYCGYWSEPAGRVHRRHRLWLLMTSLGIGGLLALMLGIQPIPAYDELLLAAQLGQSPLAHMPVLLPAFVLLMVASIVLSLDALLQVAPPPQSGSHDARRIGTQRARPWLIATALVLLTVSLLVVALIAWSADGNIARNLATSLPAFGRFDLLMSALIALASLLLGQAIVAHEIFTGKVLPRRTFVRHWRAVVILAAGYAVIVGLGLAAGLQSIYSLLLTTLLMAAFVALYSWRTFLDRERFYAHLRPFVGRPAAEGASYAHELFEVICRDVLATQRAQIVPLGASALLAGPGYLYSPVGAPAARLSAPQVDALLHARVHDSRIVALARAAAGGYDWAIPLWSERGMIGALLVGPKLDGGLYSQEEMEIAQASGERIVDMLAREQMTSRLLAVQRTRAAEQQLTDMQTRRLLHDDILPALHLVALRLSALRATDSALQDVLCTVTDLHRQIANLLTERQAAAGKSLASTNGTHDLGSVLAELVRVEFAHAFDSVDWQRVDPVPLAAGPANLAAETLIGAVREAIRNAARHARGGNPDRPLKLTLSLCAGNEIDNELDDEIVVRVQDNGVGTDFTTGVNGYGTGAGSGLTLHSTLLAIAGGYLAVESSPGAGTTVTLGLPRAQLVPVAEYA